MTNRCSYLFLFLFFAFVVVVVDVVVVVVVVIVVIVGVVVGVACRWRASGIWVAYIQKQRTLRFSSSMCVERQAQPAFVFNSEQ